MTIILTGIFVVIEWIGREINVAIQKLGLTLKRRSDMYVLCYNTCNIFVWRPGTTIYLLSVLKYYETVH